MAGHGPWPSFFLEKTYPGFFGVFQGNRVDNKGNIIDSF